MTDHQVHGRCELTLSEHPAGPLVCEARFPRTSDRAGLKPVFIASRSWEVVKASLVLILDDGPAAFGFNSRFGLSRTSADLAVKLLLNEEEHARVNREFDTNRITEDVWLSQITQLDREAYALEQEG